MQAAHSWQLTIDAHDPRSQVAFWGPVLGYVPQPPPAGFASWNDWYRSVGVPEHELAPDGEEADRLEDPTGRGPRIWFQPVPESKTVKNRLHLDVFVAEKRATPYAVRRPLVEARVAELVERGAVVHHRVDDPDSGACLAVMLDPEGNEFCVS